MSSYWYIEEKCSCCGHERKQLIAKTMSAHEPIFAADESCGIISFTDIHREVTRVGTVVREGIGVVSAERFIMLMSMFKAGKEQPPETLNSYRDEDGWFFINAKDI